MIINFLEENWLALLLFFLAIPVTKFLNQRFFPEQKLVYTLKTYRTFSKPKVKDLEVTFKRKPIPNLYFSKIIFLNTGRTAVKYDMVSKNFPLKIKSTNDRNTILDQYISYASRDANKFQLHPDLSLTFDYINPEDGCIINILFAVDVEEDNFAMTLKEHFIVKGELIGVQNIDRLSSYWTRDYNNLLFFLSMGISASLILPISNYFFPAMWAKKNFVVPISFLIVLILGVVLARPVVSCVHKVIGTKRAEILQKF